LKASGRRPTPIWRIAGDRISVATQMGTQRLLTCRTGHRIFSALGRLRDRSNVVESTQHEADRSADEIPKARSYSISREWSWPWANTRNGSSPRPHHCIKPSSPPAEPAGRDGAVDAFGLVQP